ncbi:MAG: undecaprenyldiphospho-muramoylpentapeptide beta-N-acetylglucosaminyltransferase [Candidatus Eisenbacteria bacterium]|nr:undecaprenyldiphospho-muramoylpentapeptide beta-N-acetylglucosaminyltransferase [Candidatus Eisenbacteria bacterium]
MRVMIAGGGTGGHIFPGIAIAEAIEKMAPGAEVFFAGRRNSLEENVVGRTGRRFVAVPSMGLRRRADLRNAGVPFALAAGYVTALAALLRRRPGVAVGTGGFVSVPPLLAADTLGVPILLQEQNSYPGLATRALARRAREVHVSFEEAEKSLPAARRVVLSGNPVREDLGTVSRRDARAALGLSDDSTVLLSIGGSRGARRLNEVLAGAAPRLAELGVELVAQTGERDLELVRDAAGRATRAVVEPFFEDMATVYAAADLLVSRAGATAIAEIKVVGKPSVLVPYPYATEGHQTKNAEAMERAGASVVVFDSELTADVLVSLVRELTGDRGRLSAMADAARKLARPDAADRVARAVLELGGSEAS